MRTEGARAGGGLRERAQEGGEHAQGRAGSARRCSGGGGDPGGILERVLFGTPAVVIPAAAALPNQRGPRAAAHIPKVTFLTLPIRASAFSQN